MQYMISDVVNMHPEMFRDAPKPLKPEDVEIPA